MARKSVQHSEKVVVRALRTTQGAGLTVFAFFVRGSDIVRLADISRVSRDAADVLRGFQRPEIRSHVKGIVDYLNQGKVLFPNAIILALSPQVAFAASRGTRPSGDAGLGEAGTLTIPIFEVGNRVAWIVDGQQRSLALSAANDTNIPVPVIGFVSDSLEVQREQFILVNKARPLPTRLINELLPETGGVLLPRELSSRKIPSEICNLLNRDSASPFYKLVRRISDRDNPTAVITDSALITMIRNSLTNPVGALYPYKASNRDGADVEAMYRILSDFWIAVKQVFPDAWGLDPKKSRLMHSAGIEAMGVLMDRILARLPEASRDVKSIKRELQGIAPICRWTKGTWDALGMSWNEIQNTSRDIKRLQEVLVRAYNSGGKQ